MGRLIDADVFEKFIKEKYEDGESTDDIKDQILFDLSYQPTAYDIENVVAELEDIKGYACMTMDCRKCKYTAMCFDGERSEHVAIDKAIDIVKRGGVE